MPWRHILAASLLGSAFGSIALNLEYKLLTLGAPQNAWDHYASADISVTSHETAAKEYGSGKVVANLEGNAPGLAELIWDKYQPEIPSPRLQWKLNAGENSTESFTSISMENVKSERHLAKVLNNLEVYLLFDKDVLVSGNLRVPWEYLSEADVSVKRLGTVYVTKPQPASRIVEEPPKFKSDMRTMTPEEEANNRPPPEPSFFRKYWWVFLLGYFVVNALNAQPEVPQTRETPPVQCAPKAKASNRSKRS